MTGRAPLAELLLEDGVLDEEQLGKATAFSRSRGIPLEKAVLALGLAEEDRVYRSLSKAAGLPFVPPDKLRPRDDVADAIPADQIVENGALPVLRKDGALYIAIDDPLKTYVADTLGFLAGCEVRCALAPPAALKEAIKRVTGRSAAGGAAGAERARAASDADDDAPIVRLVQRTVESALDERASDIHVEPFDGRLRVRFRVDGVLREHASLEPGLHGPLASRLKIMASMDIAERRKPQDGRIAFSAAGKHIDIRASVLPGNHGETIVLRLLDREESLRSLDALGFTGPDRERFSQIIKRPNGVFLVTGPTGSGKTTTLYAALRELNRPDVKIITAEDPVEFNLPGINQCQVRTGIGMTFARILRAMLRQAPNVILVGEIRDRDTAEIAVQAALTGHLVFSTLHTNDAPSAITRLVDMGVKPFLVSASVQAIMAQRLVRVLCEECKQRHEPSATDLRLLGVEGRDPADLHIYRAEGCSACKHSGYRGRLGIFELMEMDSQLREMTFRGESTVAIRRHARESAGMATLTDDGVRKVLAGKTSIEELLRVTAAM